MSNDSKQSLREEADRLYLRGLQLSAGSADTASADNLRVAAELLQKARELYRKVGDDRKSGKLETSLVALYKKRFTRVREKADSRGETLDNFHDWGMFLKIGCFGFGGPMAVFGLLQDELVSRKKILTHKDFLEGAVLGDILPGPVTMDIVTYTGFKLKKWYGALMSTVVFILPSFLIMILLAMLYETYSLTSTIQGALRCLGAAVTGLILSVGLNFTKVEVKDYREACILIGAFTASLVFKLDIVITVGLAGLVGILLYRDDPEEARVNIDDYAA